MLACSFTLLSCGGGTYTEQVSVLYHAETQFVLDIDKEHLEQLVSAMKIASAPRIINGRIAQVRPSNERNLNGCALSVQRKNGDLALCFLHNNLPFAISRGKSVIYNFKHILSEKDLKLFYELIPAWQNNG